MKTPKIIHCFRATKIKIFSAVFFSTCLLYSAAGQGALTPPGAPAAMMKTLDQIEPRTPVNTNTAPGNSFAQFVISKPGSYYLTGNIMSAGVTGQQGIEITTNNVTLDLNGFSLLGVTSVNASGIFITNNCNNMIVRNGIISGWGGGGGVSAQQSANDIFEHLTLAANQTGLGIGDNSTVKDCVVVSNALYGIIASSNNGGSRIIDNEISGNNTSNSSGVAAMQVNCSNNRIEGNHFVGNSPSGYGIRVGIGANNLIIRNFVQSGGANNYSIAAGNDLGPIGTAASSTSPWANFSH
jgi:hypothetical protein